MIENLIAEIAVAIERVNDSLRTVWLPYYSNNISFSGNTYLEIVTIPSGMYVRWHRPNVPALECLIPSVYGGPDDVPEFNSLLSLIDSTIQNHFSQHHAQNWNAQRPIRLDVEFIPGPVLGTCNIRVLTRDSQIPLIENYY